MPLSRRHALALLTTATLSLSTLSQPAPNLDLTITRDLPYGPHPRNLLDLYLPSSNPRSNDPLPLILCIHGGGWAGGGKQTYAWLAEAFAKQGFAAASITYRFAPDFRAPAQMDDAQRAVRFLRKHAAQYNLDPTRFGAIGGSAGAHLASYLGLMETRDNADPDLAKFPSKVQCVVDCYGPVDMLAMMSSASAPIVERFIGKPLEGHEDDYRNASPHHLINKDNTPPPFLILHGTNDTGARPGQVPIEQSTAFAEKLKNANADVTLLMLDGAGHGFSGNPNNPHARRTLTLATEFFTRRLKAR